jgi:hypothetical protein
MPEESKLNDADIDQQSRKTAGQRKINALWEYTQSIIALSITGSKIYCGIKQIPSPDLTVAFTLVISIYLIRTNHNLVGGVGSKQPNEQR